MRTTALITGASAGLGAQFARLAAADGQDVVLVARNRAALEVLAGQLTAAHGVAAHIVAADLSRPETPAAIVDQLQRDGVEVHTLVNNAGFGSHGPFLAQPFDGEARMVAVNVTALMHLTHLLVPLMKAKGAGRVLNIASTAGFQPGPFMATYYATKAFVVSFSEALAVELDGTGVTVTCHCPGATATEFPARSGNGRARLFTKQQPADAADVAAHAWRAMKEGRVLAIHGFANWVGMESVRVAPRVVVRRIAAWVNGVERA